MLQRGAVTLTERTPNADGAGPRPASTGAALCDHGPSWANWADWAGYWSTRDLLSREEIGSAMRAPVGRRVWTFAFLEETLLSANSASRPMRRSFDGSNIPSTTVSRGILSMRLARPVLGAQRGL